ncbi:MAG TPA: FAD-binding oxidoreductase [Acidimicrobiaceae bacterium]|nr:FAD-binding oxidoreductase [Acidimicrobiaceae bacterium]
MTSLDKSLLHEFESIVGASHALHEDELVASYSTDWTGRFKGSTPLVLRPGTTEEVAQILRVASDASVALVPQGGNTGLVGGSVPLRGEVVLSLLRLNVCEPVDVLAQQVTLGAGVTLAQAQNHVSPFNLAIGVDLAARDSCTIGGMIATNAGGINVVRYGPMRDQLLGVEAVTADGSSISHLEGLEKDNTGYHLPGLLAGSEGSLAVITKARLRLHPHLEERCSAMLAFKSVGDAVSATAQLRHSVPDLHAVEVIFREAMDLVSDYISTSIPVRSDGSAWLIVEAASSSDPTDQLAQAIDDLGDLVLDVAVGHDSTSRAGLWQFREKITEAVATRGTPHKLDVTLPASELAEFVNRIPEIISRVDRGATAVMFGHLGDGNVHVNVLGDDGLEPDNEVESAVLGYVAQLGGSISAEHGIGTAKKEFLHLNRSGEEIAIFRAIKSSFDPKGILSPNTLIPAEEQ